MTDQEALFNYRLRQAEETLQDAEKLFSTSATSRSVTNRAYYAVFYATLALFLRKGVQLHTSKHAGVIALFDKEFVHKGIIDKDYSRILHKLFEARQELDYKEFIAILPEDVEEHIQKAKRFLGYVKKLCEE